MKKSLATMLVAGLVGFVGCESKSTTPGGPGANRPSGPNSTDNKPIVGQANETFSLSMPTLSTKLKQGESKDITIGIKRGKNIDEDVAIKFEDVPKGVTFEPPSPMIKHGDKEA